jgi:hypothetical protein
MALFKEYSAARQQNSCSMQINKRECFRGERDERRGKPVVRIVRLKPNASGDLRPAGASLELAAKHLPGLIAMLHELQESDPANKPLGGA